MPQTAESEAIANLHSGTPIFEPFAGFDSAPDTPVSHNSFPLSEPRGGLSPVFLNNSVLKEELVGANGNGLGINLVGPSGMMTPEMFGSSLLPPQTKTEMPVGPLEVAAPGVAAPPRQQNQHQNRPPLHQQLYGAAAASAASASGQLARMCPIYHCELVSKSQDEYLRHLRETHGTSPENLQQFLVNLKIDEQSIRARNAVPAGTPHHCPHTKRDQPNVPCDSSFSRPYDLTRHIATVHGVIVSPWMCNHCDPPQVLSRRDAMHRHLEKSHREVWDDMVARGDPATLRGVRKKRRPRASTGQF